MSHQISLKDADRKVFQAAYNDGLWDILLGCFILMFAIAPLLSRSLGDFWSSAVFLPFWALAFLAVRLLRKHVVVPRIGVVDFGRARKARLAKFTVLMLAVNVLAFILGLLQAFNVIELPGNASMLMFGVLLMTVGSIAAYFLDFSRLYVYSLLVGLAPWVGEWLYTYRNAAHHGFPITFGAAAGTMMLVGAVIFVRLLRDNPVHTE